LISNTLPQPDEGLRYAALLTPQGKYLADFFVFAEGDALLIDVARELGQSLALQLTRYKLRADVIISDTELQVGQVWDGQGYADPRHPDLGHRVYRKEVDLPEDASSWDRKRVQHMIPETGVELLPNETFILEAGFERLNGVDFKKGCYVGQEVTARMKHKTELKKGLAKVSVSEHVPVGTPIESGGKPAGTLFTQSEGEGLAHLRYDRADGEMQAGAASLRLLERAV
jgi:folate-binding protein YgfZ